MVKGKPGARATPPGGIVFVGIEASSTVYAVKMAAAVVGALALFGSHSQKIGKGEKDVVSES
jgi:hypothetical protein